MSEIAVTISGLNETMELLSKAPKNIVACGYLKALKAGALVIETELHALTPERSEGERDEGDVHLRDAMKTAISLDAEFRGGTAAIGFGNKGHVALWVEYGHAMVGHKPGNKDLGHVAAHPFMRPAAAAAFEPAVEAFAQSLAQTVASDTALKGAA